MAPKEVTVTFEERRTTVEIAARGAIEGVSGEDDIKALKELTTYMNKLVESHAFEDIVTTAKEIGKKESESGVDGREIIGKLSRTLYNAAKSALEELTTIAEYAMKILKGILWGVCLIAAIIAVVSLGLVAFVVAILSAVIEGVWTVIKKVTGFVWSVFVGAVKNPAFWVTVTAVGGGVAFANPLVGAVIAGVGAIGTGVSYALSD